MDFDVKNAEFAGFRFTLEVGVNDGDLLVFLRGQVQYRLKEIFQNVDVTLVAEDELEDKVTFGRKNRTFHTVIINQNRGKINVPTLP
jgi:hypothetical protein